MTWAIAPTIGFAVMRTRFQPLNVGHEWAINLFFQHARSERVFGCDKLYLAIVDFGDVEAGNKCPRALPELNPLTEWEIQDMLNQYVTHSMCSPAGGDVLPRCRSIHHHGVPPIMSLSGGKEKKARFTSRFPVERVWFFPIFDLEDVNDIGLIWENLGPDKVIVAYHPKYAYDLRDPHDRDDRRVGIYAAAIAELYGFTFQCEDDATPVIPSGIRAYINNLGIQARIEGFANSIRRKVKRRASHPLLTNDLFGFLPEEAVVRELKWAFDKHCKGHVFKEHVQFLPPDNGSEELLAELYTVTGTMGSRPRVLDDLHHSPTIPTVKGIRGIAQALLAEVDQQKMGNAVREKLQSIADGQPRGGVRLL